MKRLLIAMLGAASIARGVSAHPPADAEVALQAGQPIVVGNVELKIIKAVNSHGFGLSPGFVRPSAGSIMIVILYTVTNRSDTALSVDDIPNVALFDSFGHKVLMESRKTRIRRALLDVYGSPSPATINSDVRADLQTVFEVSPARFNQKSWTVGFDVGGPHEHLPPLFDVTDQP